MDYENLREVVAILAENFFPSSRIHLADAIELDEDHMENPFHCSRVPRRTILHISLVGVGFHPILSPSREQVRRSRNP